MKRYSRDCITYKQLSHSAGIWRSRCAWQLLVQIIRAQSEENAISFLATLFELMLPDRFALLFLCAQVWTSNIPYQDLSCSSWINQTRVDRRCKEGKRWTWVRSHCQRARITHHPLPFAPPDSHLSTTGSSQHEMWMFQTQTHRRTRAHKHTHPSESTKPWSEAEKSWTDTNVVVIQFLNQNNVPISFRDNGKKHI